MNDDDEIPEPPAAPVYMQDEAAWGWYCGWTAGFTAAREAAQTEAVKRLDR